MAVAYVTVQTVSGASGGWTTGTSVTPGAGSNRLLVVIPTYYPGNVNNAALSNITFKGVSLHKVRADMVLTEAGSEIWWASESDVDLSSAGTLILTPTGGTPTSEEQAHVLTFSGCHQTAPIKTSAGIALTTGTGGVESTTIASDSDGYVAAGIVTFGTADITCTTTGGTERAEVQNGSNLMDSESQTVAGTGGTITVSWGGMNNTSDRAASLVSLVAAAAAGGPAGPVAKKMAHLARMRRVA